MKCKPLSWLLWGLLPILALIGYTLFSEKENIETDLTQRMQAKLNDAGVGWAKPSFDGRDGTLKGLTLAESERISAAQKADDLYGVRILDDKTALSPALDPYTWSAKTDKKTLLLDGYAPSSEAKASLLTKAGTLFAGYAITDKIKIARGASVESWTKKTDFSLTQLKSLTSGKTDLSNNDFSIQGRANSSKTYKTVKNNVRNKLVAGLQLKSDNILPPVVSPYTWSLTHSNKTVTMTGYVPNEATRKALHARIKEQYPEAVITDNTQIADGAPEKWLESATLSSKHASTLINGKASLTDKQANISGSVPDYDAYDKATNSYKSAALAGYTHTSTLTSLKAPIPVASPYTWSLTHSNKTVTMTGYVPDEATRKALHARIKEQYPNAVITDNTQIADGAPEKWLESATLSSKHASPLINGKANLTDKQANISGSVPDYEAYDKATSSYKSAALAGYTHTSTLTSLKPRIPTASPFTWMADNTKDNLILRGYAPNQAAKEKVLAAAKQRFPKKKIQDKMVIAKGAPKGWLPAAKQSLGQLRKLSHGTASLKDKNFNLTGFAKSEAVKAKIKPVAPKLGFTSTFNVTAPKAKPKPVVKVAPVVEAIIPTENITGKDSAKICENIIGSFLNREKINFQVAKATITKSSYGLLNKLANIIKKCPETNILINGHTDSDGSEASNKKLSFDRATSVYGYLMDQGIKTDRLKAAGLGESTPLVPNNSPKNKAKNRRIEFKLSTK